MTFKSSIIVALLMIGCRSEQPLNLQFSSIVDMQERVSEEPGIVNQLEEEKIKWRDLKHIEFLVGKISHGTESDRYDASCILYDVIDLNSKSTYAIKLNRYWGKDRPFFLSYALFGDVASCRNDALIYVRKDATLDEINELLCTDWWKHVSLSKRNDLLEACSLRLKASKLMNEDDREKASDAEKKIRFLRVTKLTRGLRG